jgi:hypothetical protein
MRHTDIDRDLKVFVFGNHGYRTLDDPVRGFPVSWWDGARMVGNYAEADIVFHDLGDKPYTSEVRALTDAVAGVFPDTGNWLWYTYCDFPEFATKMGGIKFVLSPGPSRKENESHNVHPVPVHCCTNDFLLQLDVDNTRAVRSISKSLNFAFIGNVSGLIPSQFFGGRQWLTRMSHRLPRMVLRNGHGSAMSDAWPAAHREWMRIVASARYGFCPAGPSNGPRGWWTMQCGTVPIFSDVVHLPFEDAIDWRKIAVFVDMSNRETFDYTSLPMDGPAYEEKRQGCIDAWERYCRMDSCAREMWRITCGYLSRAAAGSLGITS